MKNAFLLFTIVLTVIVSGNAQTVVIVTEDHTKSTAALYLLDKDIEQLAYSIAENGGGIIYYLLITDSEPLRAYLNIPDISKLKDDHKGTMIDRIRTREKDAELKNILDDTINRFLYTINQFRSTEDRKITSNLFSLKRIIRLVHSQPDLNNHKFYLLLNTDGCHSTTRKRDCSCLSFQHDYDIITSNWSSECEPPSSNTSEFYLLNSGIQFLINKISSK